MKDNHKFDAVDSQYKYHFKKWGWKKNISKSKKQEIVQHLESRARAGKSGTNITLDGIPVESQKIMRYLKRKAQDDFEDMVLKKPSNINSVATSHVLPFANSIFLKWNIPYEAMRRLHARSFDHAAPLGYSARTSSSDICVATPPSAVSPQNAPSPTTTFLSGQKAAIDRAHLFAQGQHDKLLMSLNGEERRVMSEWLYQYWFFCFKTTKSWGRGPLAWTVELLDFTRYNSHVPRSLPGTPQDSAPHSEEHQEAIPMPMGFCRWFIHVPPAPEYDEIFEEEVPYDSSDQNLNDESTWTSWPEGRQEPPLPTRLRDALEHNDFSTFPVATLPVAIPQIAKAAQRSPDELLLEALGFSIMSRNLDQVESILRQLTVEHIDYTTLYPLHVTTSYLDGYKVCCDIFTQLLLRIEGTDRHKMFVNDLGHTVLDNLMISILKSHSSAIPVVIDPTLKDTTRFMGEEVDVCGRWDADSPCVRQLLAKGNPSTPFAWKHKFCHTSIQAICHCILRMDHYFSRELVSETASGLYVRRCFDCGLKMQLQPLHSLVMTAYHLASCGCQDEDLFGMLACLLCLVFCGHNPRKTANISVTAVMQTDGAEVMCDHEELTPAELADRISVYPIMNCWSAKVQLGWMVFCGVLRLCEENYAEPENDQHATDWDEGEVCSNHFIGTVARNSQLFMSHHDHIEIMAGFHKRRDLATLWASVQAELLVYRRLNDDMAWISQNFSMEQLKGQLDRGESVSVGYAEKDLLKPHCICGDFGHYSFATLADVTNPDIANLDIWERATYNTVPDEW